MAILKKAAAVVNVDYGLDPKVSKAIVDVCDEIISGCLIEDHFPSVIWSTITQVNMNINEVCFARKFEVSFIMYVFVCFCR